MSRKSLDNGRFAMDLFGKSVLLIVGVAALAMFLAFFPDLKRYLKMRSM